MDNNKNNEIKKEETSNKNFLNLLKGNIFNIFIIFGTFIWLYYFRDKIDIWFHMIPLAILILFLFINNLVIISIMTFNLVFLLFIIFINRPDFLLFLVFNVYILSLFLQKILEKDNCINWINKKLENKLIDNILKKFNCSVFFIVYFVINFLISIPRFYFIYKSTLIFIEFKLLQKDSVALSVTAIFIEALFNTLHEKNKRKLKSIENKTLILQICKSYNLAFFIIYTIFIFFYYFNWVFFICYIIYVFYILYYYYPTEKI